MISRHLVRITAFAGFVGLAFTSPSYPAELYTLKEETGVGQFITYLIILGYLNRGTTPQSNKNYLAVPDTGRKNLGRGTDQTFSFGHR